MRHTLRFATRHPRYYHTMICRRLGPGRWEVESLSDDPRDDERATMTPAMIHYAAIINRETARLDRQLAEEGRPGAWTP